MGLKKATDPVGAEASARVGVSGGGAEAKTKEMGEEGEVAS